MDHTRKMVLVPEEHVLQLNKHNHQQAVYNDTAVPPDVRAISATLSRLDEEMNRILTSNAYRDDREKWSAYLAVLQRYLHFADSERAQQYATLAKKNAEEEEEGKSDAPAHRSEKKQNLPRMNDSIIIDSVPAKFRAKAKLLLRRLHDAPEPHFSWDSAGVVSIRGKSIKESNIVDLVNDAMRARKAPKPAGRKAFARFLREIQTPREFVGNEELWAESRANSTLQPTENRDSSHSDDYNDNEEDESISSIEPEYYSDQYQSGRSGESDNRPSPFGKTKRRLQSGGANRKIKRVIWSTLKL